MHDPQQRRRPAASAARRRREEQRRHRDTQGVAEPDNKRCSQNADLDDPSIDIFHAPIVPACEHCPDAAEACVECPLN